MNLLQHAAETLHAGMQAYAGVSVVYTRGTTSVTMTAIPSRVITQVYDERGAVLRSVAMDFVIERHDLRNLDPPIPIRNDEIRYVTPTGAEIFSVNGEDLNTAHYEDADSYGIAWRIHTKRDRYA